jgi:class 3 adenylate cyclase
MPLIPDPASPLPTLDTGSQRPRGSGKPGDLGTPASLDGKLLFRKLVAICLICATGAVVAAGMFVNYGLEQERQKSPLLYKVLVAACVTPLLYLIDLLVLQWQFRPLATFFRACETGQPSAEVTRRALVRALHFPLLTALRVLCFHGPAALAGLAAMKLWVGSTFFGMTYQTDDLVQWSFLFVIVSAHAMIEYFIVQQVFRAALPSIWAVHGVATMSEADLGRSFGIRAKLLLSSVLITVIPQAVLGFTAALKAGELLEQLGVDRGHLRPLIVWLCSLTAFTTVVTVSIATLLTRDLGQLIERLLKGFRDVESGRLDARLEILSTDEFARLYEGFNRMTAGLQERSRLHDAFGKYLSPVLAEQVMRQGLQLGGASVHATILFSDIRGFTNLSDRLKAQEIVSLLNRYFAAVCPTIEHHGGWINKFGGDSILAVFGAPLAQADHAPRAVSAALSMRAALAGFNAEQERQGAQPLRIGIGLHSGWLVVGNMGSPDRMEYTVIGDAVNIASRLQSLTKNLGVDILISAEVYQAVGTEVVVREMPAAEVQGKSMPLRIYALE